MTTIGNILLFVATLIYCTLLSAVLGKEPPRGGDAAMGYAWGVIIINIAFLICMLLVCIAISWKDGFNWISPNKGPRYLLVFFGILAAVITTGLSSLFKYEPGPVSSVLRSFSVFVPILVPLVLIVAAIILLNPGIRSSVPVAFYKWPLVLVFLLGIIGIASATGDWIKESSRNEAARMKRTLEEHDENNQRMMDEIDSCDITKNMVFLLVFTDGYKDAEVKDRAVAKVKTNPNWQQELVRLLNTDWAPEAFNFLASNKVDSAEMFIEPVRKGILIQARLIRERIRQSSHTAHFYADQFSWEVERVLRTIEQFGGKGTDYRPVVKEIRAALDEPSEFEKPVFNCMAPLDKWIKEH